MASKNSLKKRLATGKCFSCGGQRDSQKINCAKCREKHVKRNLKLRAHRHAHGLCILCGDKAVVGAKRCKHHWFQSIASGRLGTTRLATALEELLSSQKGRCVYTDKPITAGINASLDHKIPKSRGGGNEFSNLHWVDEQVNRMKNDMTHEEFIAFCIAIAKRFS